MLLNAARAHVQRTFELLTNVLPSQLKEKVAQHDIL
jgi:hypothetical protein